MMSNSRIPGSVILQKLKPFSNPQKHKELNPVPKYTGELTIIASASSNKGYNFVISSFIVHLFSSLQWPQALHGFIL